MSDRDRLENYIHIIMLLVWLYDGLAIRVTGNTKTGDTSDRQYEDRSYGGPAIRRPAIRVTGNTKTGHTSDRQYEDRSYGGLAIRRPVIRRTGNMSGWEGKMKGTYGS